MSQISNISYLEFLTNSGISCFIQDKPNNYYKTTFNKISEVDNIEDLEIFIKNSNVCDLKKTSNSTIVWDKDGNDKANIMLIGKSPEFEEDKIGKPFIGEVGLLLNKMLKAINLNRDDLYITNIIPWHIPDNRSLDNNEILECLPFIQRQIEIVNPKVILLLGSEAAKVILNSNLNITNLREKWHKYKSINLSGSILCLVTHHPNSLLKSPNLKKQAWEDLKILQKKILDENL